MTVAVIFGANGFIGRWVAEAMLAERGLDVVGAGLGTPLPGLESRWLDIDLLAGDDPEHIGEIMDILLRQDEGTGLWSGWTVDAGDSDQETPFSTRSITCPCISSTGRHVSVVIVSID